MIATIDMDPFVWLLLRIVFLLSFASRTLPARLQGKYEARLQGKYSSYAGINLPATPPPPNPIGNTPTLSITGILVIAIAVLFVGLILIALIKRLKKKKAAHNCNANSLAIAVIVGMLILVPVMRAREKALHNSNGNDLEAGADIRTYTEEQRVNPNENALEVGNLDIRTDKMEELNCLEEGIDICTYTREELAKATDNFTTKVGQGVSGFVYRANLPGNKIGAVKRATDLDPNLFKQELSVLLRLPRHPYLVDLIGLCLQPGERILVFKFISNGNLYDRLHTNRCVTSPLSWTARMDIAYQVSLALQYLHEEAKPPILHRDVKSANILLDDDNCAKLADFGLSKLGPKDNQFTGTVVRGSSKLCPNDNQFTSTAVRGSYGYMDPQYMKTQRFSAKSDVYSFGVLLLELITGLKSVHEDTPLAEWTETYRFSEDIERFMTIVDRNMRDHVNKIEVQNMIKIANLCLQDITEDRPSMREVLNMIQETRNTKENGKLLKGDIAPFLRHGNLSDGVATALSLNLR